MRYRSLVYSSSVRLLPTLWVLTGCLSAVAPVSAQDTPEPSASLLTPGIAPVSPRTGFQFNDLPKAAEVFRPSAFVEGTQSVVVMWEILPGYYLYRQSLTVTSASGLPLPAPIFPEGQLHSDEFFGESEVYFDRVMLKIPLTDLPEHTVVDLEISYQGCAQDRYCYPIQNTTLPIELP